MLDLAFPDQVPDGSCHILDRHVRVDTVLVEEIDDIGLEPLQGSFRHFPDVLGAAIETRLLVRFRVDVEAELGRDHDLVKHGCQCLADDLFVREGTIHLGGIEEGDPTLHCRTDEGDGVFPA